jgi:hypothetical protein
LSPSKFAALQYLGSWPIATGVILTARGRFRCIADMERFSARDALDGHARRAGQRGPLSEQVPSLPGIKLGASS